jgi:predicted transcriptional regulator
MANTVRVDERLHATLREIALEEKRSIGQVIEDAIRQYRKERFWDGVEEDLARLRADPVAWKDYQDEIAVWDTLSGDGLENEEPYYTVEAEFRASDS